MMDILFEMENDLLFSWHPGCKFMVTNKQPSYIVGPVGRIGPGVQMPVTKREITEIPNSLEFTIRFKNKDDNNLYLAIKNMLLLLQKNDPIEVKLQEPKLIKEKVKPMVDYVEKINLINDNNKKKTEKINELIDQLEKLGVDCDDISYRLETIPDNWYENHQYTDATLASINICCHNDTKFYKTMKDKGILEKYFPQWYKRGDF